MMMIPLHTQLYKQVIPAMSFFMQLNALVQTTNLITTNKKRGVATDAQWRRLS